MRSFWDEVARLPGLSAVIDYQPQETPWARYINALHLNALSRELIAEPGAYFLDFGCGVGRITQWLASRVDRVIGVDTSPAMIEQARQRCRQQNVQYHLLESCPTTLPFRDLDGVVVIWVLQHILDDKLFESVLDYLALAMRPGGAVYTLDRLTRDAVDHGESDYLRLRTRAEYTGAFASRGLTLQSCHPVSINEQVLNSPGLTRLIKRGSWLPSLWARGDLAWARRQQDPLIADYIFRFTR